MNVSYDECCKVLHTNIRSLRKNWEHLQQTLIDTEVKWDVIVITEINIKKEEIVLYELDGYTQVCTTREQTKRGGGIIIFIKNMYEVEHVNHSCLENDIIELRLELKKNSIKTRIFAVYKRPVTSKNEFIKTLKRIIQNQKGIEFKNEIIIGDINIDILKNEEDVDDKYEQKLIDKYEDTLARLGFEKKNRDTNERRNS